jgi:sulfur relay (sulfurtransferase) complex TusBCD TusD component (DsrE family)
MKMCALVAVPGRAMINTLKRLYEDYKNNIELFLYNDGVFLLNEPSFIELSKHVKTTICDVSANERGLKKQEGIVSGSLYDLSRMVAHADKFISFARGS